MDELEAINEELFWKKVKKTNHCWFWIGAKDKKGYGIFRVSKLRRNFRAHRISYLINKRKIPFSLIILHSCDNPSCVNPDHLSAGTSKQNTRDMINKNRNSPPPNNSDKQTIKLPNSIISKLGTMPDAELAKIAGVGPWIISRRRNKLKIKQYGK